MHFSTILLNTPQGDGGMSILMIVILIVIFYFFMIRPQQKRQKKLKQQREAMGKGDTIITAGGIYGRIKEVKDTVFMISVSDNCVLKVDKGSVYPSAADAKESADDKTRKDADSAPKAE